MLLRVNRGLQTHVGDQVHVHQVGLAVPFNSPRPDGFPSPADSEALSAIEDRIDELYKAADGHLFSMVVTTNGMREFVIYTSNPDAAQAKYETLTAMTTTHRIQISIESDPDWKAYKELSSGGS